MKKIRFSEIESIAKSLKIDVVGFTDEYDSEIIEKKLMRAMKSHTEYGTVTWR